MTEFNQVWQLLRQHGSSAKREKECAEVWATYDSAKQDLIYETIRTKMEHHKFVHYDPLRALKENAMALQKQQLSYRAYYAKYGTTEERDGWKMVNPTGRQVIYVRERMVQACT